MNRSMRNRPLCPIADPRPRPRSGGFTLAELLVVIATLSLLMSLLLPALRAARQRAATVRCLANLRALGMAVREFADQHQGAMPKVKDIELTPLLVRKELEPYVGEERVFLCSRDPVKPRLPGGSYDWRFTDAPKASLAKVRLDCLRHPSLAAIGGDRRPNWHRRHTINVLFADLHVAQVGEQDWFDGIRSPLR